jgi:hypothetical protein
MRTSEFCRYDLGRGVHDFTTDKLALVLTNRKPDGTKQEKAPLGSLRRGFCCAARRRPRWLQFAATADSELIVIACASAWQANSSD